MKNLKIIIIEMLPWKLTERSSSWGTKVTKTEIKLN